MRPGAAIQVRLVTTKNGDDAYVDEKIGYVSAHDVECVLPFEYRYHSYRPPQQLTKIRMNSGLELLVWDTADSIMHEINEALGEK